MLLSRLQLELELYNELGLVSANLSNLTIKWKSRVTKEPAKFIQEGHKLNIQAIQNFRHLHILLEDWPGYNLDNPIWRRYTDGSRALRRWLINTLKVLQEFKYDGLLKKYPCPTAGNPFIFRYSGYNYTYRWIKQIYYLGLLKSILGNTLKDDFVALDLGCGWGFFNSILKKDFPKSHHVLVDFPEMLMLAYYFLGSCFPEAKMAGIKEIHNNPDISRSFIEQYDFVFIPVTFYKNLGKETVDLYTNFGSLAEMKREWFDYYMKSIPFKTAKYFFTVNRITSLPDYDTDVTLLDYHSDSQRKVLHFAIHPMPSGVDLIYKRVFFHTKKNFPPLFEYIGEVLR